MSPSSGPGMLFILGRGRSGTTMLRCLLDAHPQLSIAPEAMFIMLLRGRYSRVKRWSRRSIDRFLEDLWRETRLRSWNLDRDALETRLRSKGADSYAELCRLVYESYAASSGKGYVAYLGDKNPHYCLFAEELLDLYPDARFVHFVRDPRDNVLSFKRVRFDADGAAALAYRWDRYNREVLRLSERAAGKTHLMRYEDLITEPAARLAELCAFLGTDYDPAMLRQHETRRNAPTWEWHHNLEKPVDSSRAEGWRDGMSQEELRVTEAVCGELMEQLGYERALENPSAGGLGDQAGLLWGRIMTAMERLVFRLPFGMRTGLVNLYRRMTGSLDPLEGDGS